MVETSTNDLHIEPVPIAAREQFRAMVEAYWREVMPHASACQSPEARDGFFEEIFTWAGGNRHPHWVLMEEQPIGFVSFEIEGGIARVHDFYVVAEHQRKGYGTKIVDWLFVHFDGMGVRQLDLHVRRDNPNALLFWMAQGFGIAGYRMRMYRDPETHTAYKGVLSSDFVDAHASKGKMGV